MYLTAGGSGDDNVHVSSATTPTLRSEYAWGYVFRDNKQHYLLLLSLCFGALSTHYFTTKSDVNFGIVIVLLPIRKYFVMLWI
jgi:hypothetical protein